MKAVVDAAAIEVAIKVTIEAATGKVDGPTSEGSRQRSKVTAVSAGSAGSAVSAGSGDPVGDSCRPIAPVGESLRPIDAGKPSGQARGGISRPRCEAGRARQRSSQAMTFGRVSISIASPAS